MMTFRTSWMKPMSSIRSASSSTKISMPDRSSRPWPDRSSRRPGVAVRMPTPFLICSTWGAWPTPPKMTASFRGRFLPYAFRFSSIWMASSRVGVRMRARMASFLCPALFSRCRMGTPKAQVFPVPVWALPSTSRPARPAGMAFSWIRVGVS